MTEEFTRTDEYPPSPYSPDDLVVYTHPVVTGGTTFSDMLDKYFWQKDILLARNVADQRLQAELDTPMKRRDNRDAALIHGYAKPPRAKLVRGHHHLAHNRRQVWGDRSVKYITLLRHPVSRFISHSRYAVNDLETLAKLRGNDQIDFNHQTTYVSGCDTLAARPEDLETAKANLECYFFVGITEHYEESMQLFAKLFGLPYVGWSYNKYHVAKKKSPIPEAVKEKIAEYAALDMELYDYAVEIFRRKQREAVHVPLLKPSATQKLLFKLRTLDQYRAKGKRYLREKFRSDINQQKTVEDFLTN